MFKKIGNSLLILSLLLSITTNVHASEDNEGNQAFKTPEEITTEHWSVKLNKKDKKSQEYQFDVKSLKDNASSVTIEAYQGKRKSTKNEAILETRKIGIMNQEQFSISNVEIDQKATEIEVIIKWKDEGNKLYKESFRFTRKSTLLFH